eukprot:sb/3477996/
MAYRYTYKAEKMEAKISPDENNLWVIRKDKCLEHTDWVVTVEGQPLASHRIIVMGKHLRDHFLECVPRHSVAGLTLSQSGFVASMVTPNNLQQLSFINRSEKWC